MLYAIILFLIMLYGPVLVDKLEVPAKKQMKAFIGLWRIVAFVAFAIVGSWLLYGIPRGEEPVFSLWPLAIIGLLALLGARRANKVYKQRYHTLAK